MLRLKGNGFKVRDSILQVFCTPKRWWSAILGPAALPEAPNRIGSRSRARCWAAAAGLNFGACSGQPPKLDRWITPFWGVFSESLLRTTGGGTPLSHHLKGDSQGVTPIPTLSWPHQQRMHAVFVPVQEPTRYFEQACQEIPSVEEIFIEPLGFSREPGLG